MNEKQALELRFYRAMQMMREAQQRKCEAVWEFVQAREALLEIGVEATDLRQKGVPQHTMLPGLLSEHA